MADPASPSRLIRFGVFEVDLRTGELRKHGLKIKLHGQPIDVLAVLLENPGEMVTREELQKRLWPEDTFVDFDHSLNTAINKLREVLGDSADNPKYVETLPRRGYRFIYPVEALTPGSSPTGRGGRFSDLQPSASGRGEAERQAVSQPSPGGERVSRLAGTGEGARRYRFAAPAVAASAGIVVAILLALNVAGLRDRLLPRPAPAPVQRPLTQLTFEAGLNAEPTWSPDGRFIAFSSDRSGNFDIWVQPPGGGDPVQVTKDPAHDWQPDWSPKGDLIAFRSEREGGGIYVAAALGGQERRVANFGFRPRWSSDGSRILFGTTPLRVGGTLNYFVVGLDSKAPRDVMRDFMPRHGFAGQAAWHPDGERISFWGWKRDVSPARRLFWTARLEAGTNPVASGLTSQVRKQMEAASVVLQDFAWTPSGRAIFFEGISHGVRNVWKVTADPGTLRWNGGPERLTAGPGPDRDLALSADGKKLAFSARRESTRYWAFPFNATTGKVTGAGQPVSPEGVDALEADLTPDGDKLVFGLSRAGKYELWAKSLLDGKETLLAKDEFVRDVPRWSPDGKHLVYRRMRAAPNQPWQQSQVVLLGERGKGEQALTSEYPPAPYTFATGWSPDGQNIVVSRAAPAITIGIWVMPVSDPARAEAETRLVTYRPGYNLYQGRFSPNGKWISFNATKLGGAPGTTKVTIFVVPATGGEWVRISEDGAWSDKARWSPDGRTLYYVSSRTGFFNVWGRRFDPVRGQPLGEAFLVPSFENPGRIIPLEIEWFEISLSEDRLVVPITEITGNIWMLENVDQ